MIFFCCSSFSPCDEDLTSEAHSSQRQSGSLYDFIGLDGERDPTQALTDDASCRAGGPFSCSCLQHTPRVCGAGVMGCDKVQESERRGEIEHSRLVDHLHFGTQAGSQPVLPSWLSKSVHPLGGWWLLLIVVALICSRSSGASQQVCRQINYHSAAAADVV